MDDPPIGPDRSTSQLLDLVDRLVVEFDDQPAGSIIRSVVAAQESLVRAGTGRDLARSVELAVRRRMAASLPAPRVDGASYRRRAARHAPLVLPSLRGYRHRTGSLFVAERMTIAGTWLPLIRLRVRRLRAADGGSEL